MADHWCSTCGKNSFPTFRDALRAHRGMRRRAHRTKLKKESIYPCPTLPATWHTTSLERPAG